MNSSANRPLAKLLPPATLIATAVFWVGGVTETQATSEFNKAWKAHYLEDPVSDEFKKTARKAGCYVCHVKGEKKKVRNEYGEAVHEFLDKEEYTKDYVKANKEQATEEMIEGIKKAGEKSSLDGKTFEEKLAEGVLPATNAGLE